MPNSSGLTGVRQRLEQPTPRKHATCQEYDVSIVIVSWNTRDLLRDCLQSISFQAGPVLLEVIVVDNHSSDGSADMVAMEFPWVRLIRNAANRGFAAANNQGICVARGRYVLLLNPDTLILDGAIAKAVRFADQYPKAAVVGCRTVCGDGSLQYNCFMFPSLLNLAFSLTRLAKVLRGSRLFGRDRMSWWDYATPRVVDVVAGCYMLVRRLAIDDVGLMDESYFMYSEEADWCWRFWRRGWETMYTPDACIVHFRQASTSQSAAEMRVLQRRSILMFLEKKSGKRARYIANAMFVLVSVLGLPLLAFQRLAGGQAAEAAGRRWRLSLQALRFHLVGRLPDER